MVMRREVEKEEKKSMCLMKFISALSSTLCHDKKCDLTTEYSMKKNCAIGGGNQEITKII